MDLIGSLNRKFGTSVQSESRDCSRGIGGCRGAPLMIVLTWQPEGAEITLTYRNKKHYAMPKLEYTSTGWLAQQLTLKEQASVLEQRAAQIERTAVARAAAQRGDDL